MLIVCYFVITLLRHFSLSLFRRFQPPVKPIEIGALPKNTILGFQHPVVFVGEDEQLGLDALHAGGIESRHALCGIDAIVFLSVNLSTNR